MIKKINNIKYFVYKITTQQNDIYIGATSNYEIRMKQHEKRFKIKQHEILKKFDSLDECAKYEQEMIKKISTLNSAKSPIYLGKYGEQTMDYTYYSIKTLDNNKKESRRNYMTLQQKLEVINDINEIALFLLEFYYSKTGTKYDYSDKQVAHAIGWTEKKVAENRRKLEKNKYFKKEVTKNSKSSTLNILLGHERWKK